MADDSKVLEREVEDHEKHIKIVEDGIRCIIARLREEPYSRERDSELVGHIAAVTRDERGYLFS